MANENSIIRTKLKKPREIYFCKKSFNLVIKMHFLVLSRINLYDAMSFRASRY